MCPQMAGQAQLVSEKIFVQEMTATRTILISSAWILALIGNGRLLSRLQLLDFLGVSFCSDKVKITSMICIPELMPLCGERPFRYYHKISSGRLAHQLPIFQVMEEGIVTLYPAQHCHACSVDHTASYRKGF